MEKKYKIEHNTLFRKVIIESLTGEPIAPEELNPNWWNDYLIEVPETELPAEQEDAPVSDPNQLDLFACLELDFKNEVTMEELEQLADRVMLTFPEPGIKRVDLDELKERFDFLAVNKYVGRVMLPLCMGCDRNQTQKVIFRGKNCIDTKFYEFKNQYGIKKDVLIKEMLICSKEDYRKNYLVMIENNRQLFNHNHLKKKNI